MINDLTSFLPEHLAILISATYVLGIFLKQSNAFKDNHIPIALMIFCIGGSILLTVVNTEYSSLFAAISNSFFQGILCWGVSIGVNQTLKQLKKGE